jgi:tetraacyldisaccharide 4'-kinase
VHVVCTLKDAVKLEALWPRAAPPLWYVSQRLTIEGGEVAYLAAIRQVLDARRALGPT